MVFEPYSLHFVIQFMQISESDLTYTKAGQLDLRRKNNQTYLKQKQMSGTIEITENSDYINNTSKSSMSNETYIRTLSTFAPHEVKAPTLDKLTDQEWIAFKSKNKKYKVLNGTQTIWSRCTP